LKNPFVFAVVQIFGRSLSKVIKRGLLLYIWKKREHQTMVTGANQDMVEGEI
jgi:hypothetical protein